MTPRSSLRLVGIVNHLSKGELEAMDNDGMIDSEENIPFTEKDNGDLKA